MNVRKIFWGSKIPLDNQTNLWENNNMNLLNQMIEMNILSIVILDAIRRDRFDETDEDYENLTSVIKSLQFITENLMAVRGETEKIQTQTVDKPNWMW